MLNGVNPEKMCPDEKNQTTNGYIVPSHMLLGKDCSHMI